MVDLNMNTSARYGRESAGYQGMEHLRVTDFDGIDIRYL